MSLNAPIVGNAISAAYWKVGAIYNFGNLILSNGARTLAYTTAYYSRPILLDKRAPRFFLRTWMELIHFSNKGKIDIFKTGENFYNTYQNTETITDAIEQL